MSTRIPRRRALLVAAATVFAAGPLAAQATTFGAKMHEITSRPEYAHSEFGVTLYDLDSGRVLYSLNGNRFFTPGSTTKLLTEGTTLALFGADYRFHTPVYRTGPVKNGTLHGDLVLVASGDPNLSGRIQPGDTLGFTDEDHAYAGSPETEAVPGDPLLVIRELAGKIASSGIKRVTGRVLVDASLFPQGEREGGTNVVISPAVVNDNVIDVTVGPGAKEGDPVVVHVSPDVGYMHLTIQATTSAAGSRPRIGMSDDEEAPPDSQRADGTHDVTLRGSFPAGMKPILYVYKVPDPARFAEVALTFALKEKGVDVRLGPEGQRPDFTTLAASYTDANRVAEHVSPRLAEDVKATLKVSQNLHASTMPYLWGALVAKKHGNGVVRAGFQQELAFLKKAGLDTDGASQSDGAGGATAAFFTPDFMVHYLAYMATRPDFALFHRALPILGKDGTLWNIQTDSPAAGHVFAKTGTYGAVDLLHGRLIVTGKGLAGYIDTADGKHLAFAAYANRVPRPLDVDDPALLVGQALGEIAAAAYSLPIETTGPTASSGGN